MKRSRPSFIFLISYPLNDYIIDVEEYIGLFFVLHSCMLEFDT